MKLKYNKIQTTLEIITILILIGMIVFTILQWGSAPDKIPEHYNAGGEVDKWGSKSMLLIMPIASIAFYFIITIIGFFPTIWNVPVAKTEENKTKIYTLARYMIMLIKIEFISGFFYITYNEFKSTALPSNFDVIFIAITLGTLIYCIKRMYRIAKKTS